MGADPIAMLSDLHLADDGDVGKLFDFTAGVCAVSELVDVPLVAGSTLRVGGDMVLGDRLVSAVGAVGISAVPPNCKKKSKNWRCSTSYRRFWRRYHYNNRHIPWYV